MVMWCYEELVSHTDWQRKTLQWSKALNSDNEIIETCFNFWHLMKLRRTSQKNWADCTLRLGNCHIFSRVFQARLMRSHLGSFPPSHGLRKGWIRDLKGKIQFYLEWPWLSKNKEGPHLAISGVDFDVTLCLMDHKFHGIWFENIKLLFHTEDQIVIAGFQLLFIGMHHKMHNNSVLFNSIIYIIWS